MHLKSREFVIVLLLGLVILLGSTIYLSSRVTRNPFVYTAQVLSGISQNTTLSIHVSTKTECSNMLTQVFFDVTPPDSAEVVVNDESGMRTFGVMQKEAGKTVGYFSDGTYQAKISPKTGYTVKGEVVQFFTVSGVCTEDVSIPSIAPETTAPPTTLPTEDRTDTLTVDQTVIETIPSPEIPKSRPLTSTEILRSSGVTESIVLCASGEACLNICTTKNTADACNNYIREKLLANPASRVEHLDQSAIAVFLEERQGARIFIDSDGEGISNFDEINIYGTNPNASDSDDDGISDGTELLTHTHPLSAGAANDSIFFEDPRTKGATSSKFTISAITPEATTTDIDGKIHVTAVKFSGSAPANSFIVLYIFSEPIIATVRSDADGAWIYTLNKELPDGEHEVVTAITDLGGRILARSEPLPFIKQAEAFSIGSKFPARKTQPSFFEGTSLMIGFLILVIALVSSFIVIATVTQSNEYDTGTPMST
jgi:hypothetical protein